MTQPRIDWQDQKLYFHDAQGVVWRVYDCMLIARRPRAIPLSDPRAVHRAFVSRHGERRILEFDRTSARAISPRTLEQQLKDSRPAPAERDEPRADAPEAEAR